MSALKTQLTDDMKNAMRAKEMMKLNTIRFLLAAIKNWEIDNGDAADKDVQQAIAREVKKMKDAIGDFEKAGRQDIVDEENAKLAVMEAYLPTQMSDDDLKAKVAEVAAKSQDKNFGLVMKAVMAEVQGQADGGRVSAMVKQVLGS